MDKPKIISAWKDSSCGMQYWYEGDVGLSDQYIHTTAPELTALTDALVDAIAQIDYLHGHMGVSTGSGNAVMARGIAAVNGFNALIGAAQ